MVGSQIRPPTGVLTSGAREGRVVRWEREPSAHIRRPQGATMNFAALKIPVALRPRAGEIVEITDAFCAEHLDAEYGELCRRLVARLARKRPSPLERGEPRIWAAGSSTSWAARTSSSIAPSSRS